MSSLSYLDKQNSIIVALCYYAVLPLAVAYLYLVKVWIPRKMRDRNAMCLKKTIMIYNLLQILMNVYIIKKCFSLMGMSLLNLWSNLCSPVSAVYTGPDVRSEIFSIVFYYNTNKVMDLLDTIFYSVRKKESQITFLHVIHHEIALWMGWVNVFYIKDELAVRLITLNTSVHVIMYIYYFLAGIGVSAKYLWWKKYVTKIQILQFLAGITMLAKMMLDGCESNLLFIVIWGVPAVFFLILFLDFYKKTYTKGHKEN
ncbi:very long chain fatty acid elongase 7 [Halyomorpha halys]|uniref:very long chain fatty acid elongase 7 n=1 Tax=Halyomorpha halys TaxID=286706 RepID=UPI0006D500CF|nr:elongation of very long chain fatty acids protein 7-like [Halyomorpha halys]